MKLAGDVEGCKDVLSECTGVEVLGVAAHGFAGSSWFWGIFVRFDCLRFLQRAF